MDRIQYLSDGWHRLACPAPDISVQANHSDGALRRRERLVSLCYAFVVKPTL